MGGFLVNVFVRSDDQAAVARAARGALAGQYGRNSENQGPLLFVSPSLEGWVGVHDMAMQGQDEALCAKVAKDLSSQLGTAAIAFLVHDGDFLCYWLAKNGALVDQYNSMPSYFNPRASAKPSGGNSTALAEVCGRPDKVLDIAKLLKNPEDDAFDFLEKLGALLGIPDPCVDYGLLVETDNPYPPEVQERERYLALTWRDLAS